MVKISIIPDKIPKVIWNKKDYEEIILYALGAFGPLETKEFINKPEELITNRIDKDIFKENISFLTEKQFLIEFTHADKVYYKLTPQGEDKLLKRIKQYPIIMNIFRYLDNILG